MGDALEPGPGPGPDPGDEVREFLEGQAWKGAERLTAGGLKGWWAALDSGQKTAWRLIAAAAVLGPLGQGALAALRVLYGSAAPGAKQLAAVFWLAAIAAPLFLAALAAAYFLGRAQVAVVLILAAAGAYAGGLFLASTEIPENLGDFYCYANYEAGTIVYEKACRAFDARGFLAEANASGGGTSGSAEILGWAWIYTADVRGTVMAACAVVAGGAVGYLLRRQNEVQP